ncbi:MAG: electron transport complex subunit E [Candidatus Omnitrophica bacterium]|nr:electron transport complex subunit E [Candidatus Omnitrophota bacterium]
MKVFGEFIKGLWRENPTFRIMLGLCPTLAVSTSVENAIGMGSAAAFVLVGSNIFISLVRKIIPDKVRIPCFIVIIATFVTIVELMMKAYAPLLSRSLGIYVPLIVVNCIVLGRAEAFSSKEPVFKSILDALGMGLGFTWALVMIASIRELLGSGSLLGFTISKHFEPPLFMILAPGALLTIGLLIGMFNHFIARSRSRKTDG